MTMEERRIEEFRKRREDGMAPLPEGFYDTFNFVRTGKIVCHPVTVGLTAKLASELEGTAFVGCDVRLNRGKGKSFSRPSLPFVVSKMFKTSNQI